MGWPGPRRPQFTLRVSEEGMKVIDDLAIQAGLLKSDGTPNRSEMGRRLLSAAVSDPTIRRKVTETAS